MAKKLAALRDHFRRWAKFSFGSIKLKKLELLQEVEKLDIAKESRCLSWQELQIEQVLLEKLWKIRK